MRAWGSSTPTGGPSASSGAGSASTTRAARSTPSTRCVTTGSCGARSSRAGACSAATRGAAAGSTTSSSRGSSIDLRLAPLAAREPSPEHPRLAAQLGRAHLGVVDRRADPDGPAPAGAADGQADPLDAEPAAPRAADEGDPAEVQGRPREAAGRADEVLQGEQHQPDGVVPADGGAVPGVHRALPRAPEVREEPPGRRPLLAPRLRPGHHRARERALVGIRAARGLRRQPDPLDAAHVRDDGQDAADDVPHPAADLHLLPAQLPGGPGDLLGDDEPVDGRPGPCDAADDAQGSASAEALVPHSAEGGDRPGWGGPRAGAGTGRCAGRGARGAQAGQAEEEERRGAAVTDDGPLQVEATGETVGEAKWSALRELEKLQPGIDKGAVQFQGSSE